MDLFKFGRIIPGLKIYGEDAPYPVLNERDARAGAGIMFVVALFAAINAGLLQNYLFLEIVVFLFLVEFIIRVFFNPELAPFYAMGRLIVSNQVPEYSGAAQKRFAWGLGMLMATAMIIAYFVLGIRGIMPFAICGTCIILLWLESSFGICMGCKMYYRLMSIGLIPKPQIMPACPGGVCKIPKKK
jgi:hypothetical protein